MYDRLLQEKFDSLIFKIKRRINTKNDEIEEALYLIKDEKIFRHMPDTAFEKIIQLENILKEKNIQIPSELIYRKASIFFEARDDVQNAEKLFIALINNTKTAKALKSRARFSLCKLYLKRISEQYNKEVFDKAKNLYEDLEKNIKETDEYIYGSLWELKRKLKDFENNKYIVESFPYYTQMTNLK